MDFLINMELLFYCGTGIVAIIALGIFLAGVVVSRMPEPQPRKLAYSMVRKHPRRRLRHRP